MNVSLRKSVWAGLLSLISTAAAATPIDMSGWTALGNGTWTLSPDGLTVQQIDNGNPTVFLSNDEYINTRFEGTFGVNTASDDDFIGFVFGYDNSTDFILFDWKQNIQSLSQDGFRLAQINGSVGAYSTLSGAGVNLLGTDYGTTINDRGWLDNEIYQFKLDFTDSRIVIDIAGETIFDVTGSFDSGRFGFYNYSQQEAVYGNLNITNISSIPTPAPLALLGLGLLGLWWQKRRA